MEPSRWAREALEAHVAGAQIMMRTRTGANLPVPEWLAAAAADVSPADSAESLEMTHPDDRTLLVSTFLDAAAEPGVEHVCRIRAHLGDVWFHTEVSWTDLTDVAEVGGILCTVRVVDGPPIEPPTETDGASVHSATNWVILVLEPNGAIRGVRGALVGILGYEVDEVLGRVATDFVHPAAMAGAVQNWITLREHPEQTRTSRQVWVRKDGSPVWVETSFLVHTDGNVEMVIVDVDERVANEAALARSRAELAALAEDLRLVADEVPTPVFRADAEGHLDFHNGQWAESFPDQDGAPDLWGVVHPDDVPALRRLLADLAREPGVSRTLEVRDTAGERVLSIRCRAVGTRAGDRRVVGSITDITSTVELRHQATHDALTGLANRPMITALLATAMAEEPHDTLVLFVDLDGFKEVNDVHGHDAGDAALAEVARRLRTSLRPGDHVGRYGGDEFVVVCRGARDVDPEALIARLRGAAFGEPVEVPGGSWHADGSFGHARPWEGADVAAVLRSADESMFVAKRRRRGDDGSARLGR